MDWSPLPQYMNSTREGFRHLFPPTLSMLWRLCATCWLFNCCHKGEDIQTTCSGVKGQGGWALVYIYASTAAISVWGESTLVILGSQTVHSSKKLCSTKRSAPVLIMHIMPIILLALVDNLSLKLILPTFPIRLMLQSSSKQEMFQSFLSEEDWSV